MRHLPTRVRHATWPGPGCRHSQHAGLPAKPRPGSLCSAWFGDAYTAVSRSGPISNHTRGDFLGLLAAGLSGLQSAAPGSGGTRPAICEPWRRGGRACSASGTVSPRCTIVRIAWISGVMNSCPRSLNSLAWHLRASPPTGRVQQACRALQAPLAGQRARPLSRPLALRVTGGARRREAGAHMRGIASVGGRAAAAERAAPRMCSPHAARTRTPGRRRGRRRAHHRRGQCFRPRGSVPLDAHAHEAARRARAHHRRGKCFRPRESVPATPAKMSWGRRRPSRSTAADPAAAAGGTATRTLPERRRCRLATPPPAPGPGCGRALAPAPPLCQPRRPAGRKTVSSAPHARGDRLPRVRRTVSHTCSASGQAPFKVGCIIRSAAAEFCGGRWHPRKGWP